MDYARLDPRSCLPADFAARLTYFCRLPVEDGGGRITLQVTPNFLEAELVQSFQICFLLFLPVFYLHFC